MRICVAYVAPDTELMIALELADGAIVDDALRASGIVERIGVPDAASLAVFGRRVNRATALRDGDRVEVTRPLLCDPKAVRRNRAARSDGTPPRNPPPGTRRSKL